MDNFAPAINIIQALVGAKTPGEAVEKVRAMVEGHPTSEPPPLLKSVLIQDNFNNRAVAYLHSSGCWVSDETGDNWPFDVVRWWELP